MSVAQHGAYPGLRQPAAQRRVPEDWRAIDFISDVHLQAGAEATVCAWQDYMLHTRADAICILGDLFEVWLGDDTLHAPQTDLEANFARRCAAVLRQAAQRCTVWLMRGNRDFLLGPGFAQHCGVELLEDPTLLHWGSERYLLAHGDALCLDDSEYQQFRAMVRTAQWQKDFLRLSLAQRQTQARAIRARSEAHKRSSMALCDVHTHTACAWLDAAQAHTLIHGHTHRPADSVLRDLASQATLQRCVLSDWDAQTQPARTQVLRLSAEPNQTGKPRRLQRLDAAQA